MELSFLRRTIQSKNGDDHRTLLMLIFFFFIFCRIKLCGTGGTESNSQRTLSTKCWRHLMYVYYSVEINKPTLFKLDFDYRGMYCTPSAYFSLDVLQLANCRGKYRFTNFISFNRLQLRIETVTLQHLLATKHDNSLKHKNTYMT